MRTFALLTAALLLAFAELAAAHGGGLNAQGCHNNRKTGDYHCHRAQAPAAVPATRAAPARFLNEERAAPQAGKRQPTASGASVYYANCTAAREAGAAPVRRGDPGYAKHLDRDNDGIGCE